MDHQFSLCTGGNVQVTDQYISVSFDRERYALSTAIWGGGLRMIQHAVNWKLTGYYATEQDFPGGSIEEYLRLSMLRIGLPQRDCCTLLTSARMDWHVLRRLSCHGLTVEVIATAGVEKTAARAGEPSFYEERDRHFYPAGTINLMVFLNGRLPDSIMARSLITITEGKTAALQDMGIASCSSGASATGTATDGVTFVTDPEGPLYTDAGSFSKLGELLARTVHDAVTACIADFDRPWNQFDQLTTPPPVRLDNIKKK